jgi:hypothetical protein
MPGYVVATTWSGHRLLALVDEAPRALELMTLDPAGGQVLQRRRLARQVVAAAAFHDRIVAITAPAGSIGPARLLVSQAGVAPRQLVLSGIVAGWSGTRFVVPALTVVRSAGRAFVVGTNGALATVDLGHGTVAYRYVRGLSAVEKGIAASVRHAAWLGGGHLAVSGWTERNRPAGLTLLDVHSGSSRLLDPSTDSLTAGHGTLLGYRFAFPPTREFPGGGVTFYDPSGRRRLHLLGRSTIAAAAIVGTRAYIDPDELHVLVVDLKTGKTVATAEGELPELLVGTPTWSRIQ